MFFAFREIFKSFGKLTKLLRPREKTILGFATIIMMVVGGLTNLPAVLLGKFVDLLIATQNPSFQIAIPFLLAIVAIIISKEVLTVFRKYLVENIATHTEKEQTLRTINQLLKVNLSFFQENQIGALHGRIFRSIQGAIRLLKLSFLDFFPFFFSALAALVIAFTKNSLFSSFMILVIPAGFFLILWQISSQKGIRVTLLREKEKIDGKVVEMMGGIESVRVADTAEFELSKLEKISEKLRLTEIRHHIQMALFDAAKYLNESFFYVLVVGISTYFAVNGTISKGDILTYSLLFTSILSPLRELHRVLDEAHESSIRVQDLLNLQSQKIDASFLAKETKEKISGKDVIKIQNLSFSYPDKKDSVLTKIDLNIKQGEKIGIVGSSGCGKSTLLKILLRLVHDYRGKVFVLGKDLKSFSRKNIAKVFAYVPQKTYIFSGSIRENITYGCVKKTTNQEIQFAAQKANIWTEIQKNLGGLSGRVAENGNNLSGGQKQRLALAKIILQSPEILIFDEATSALDNTNEAIIQKNLEKIFSDKTMLIVAHRLTTLKNCDRIFVFDNGKIVQEGNFATLSQKEGPFSKFLKQVDS